MCMVVECWCLGSGVEWDCNLYLWNSQLRAAYCSSDQVMLTRWHGCIRIDQEKA